MAFHEEEVVVLIDEDGAEIEFEIIEIFELNNMQYAFLYPLDDNDDEAIIMKIVQDENNEDILVDIEDDEEWSNVIEAWEEIIQELEEEEAEEEELDTEEN